jgi:hypothetical protein
MDYWQPHIKRHLAVRENFIEHKGSAKTLWLTDWLTGSVVFPRTADEWQETASKSATVISSFVPKSDTSLNNHPTVE